MRIRPALLQDEWVRVTVQIGDIIHIPSKKSDPQAAPVPGFPNGSSSRETAAASGPVSWSYSPPVISRWRP